MGQLLLATNNAGKVREFRRLLAGSAFTVVTPADLGIALDVEETGSTYPENAALKARTFAHEACSLAIADDSGIEVDALDGRPGVFSARYGGPGLDDAGRTRHLLEEMRRVPDAERTARYRAVVAIADAAGKVHLFEGVQEGSIGHEERGDGGFGYDPVFLHSDGRSNAQLSDEEKDRVSHRGQAVRAAVVFLKGARQ
jgi:XTP/dITP diphosphohydrolase